MRNFFLDKDTGFVSVRDAATGKAVPVPKHVLYKHALGRLRERCGERIADLRTIYRMEKQIHDGRAKLIKKTGTSRSLYEVNWDGGSFFPIHDQETQTIVTFLDSAMAADTGQFGRDGSEPDIYVTGKSFTIGDTPGTAYREAKSTQIKPEERIETPTPNVKLADKEVPSVVSAPLRVGAPTSRRVGTQSVWRGIAPPPAAMGGESKYAFITQMMPGEMVFRSGIGTAALKRASAYVSRGTGRKFTVRLVRAGEKSEFNPEGVCGAALWRLS